ncbi:hypothetical protein RHSIM_Rhsim09G0085600 [Rhododendron simsii]|uniref:Cyclin N-terminal domain-containing protein n=1 Tax=Rhododendron simsii TaxID=118357 RepID=A0A834LFB5_RHOSS|nr:hypothetical protein RHSIM_Rhsim09G0085600 [Rhododendron simsii]
MNCRLPSCVRLRLLEFLIQSAHIHDSQPLSVKILKLLGDKMIKEQHFTTRDFLEAEVLLMQVLGFEIGTANIAFKFLEELFIEFEGVARVGQLVNFEASMDIMDLLYEKEETSPLYYSPRKLAASILACPFAFVNSKVMLLLCLYFRRILDLLQVATYVVTVPKQKWEFPVLPWGKYSLLEVCTLYLFFDVPLHS